MVVDLRPVSAKSGGSGSSENFPPEIPRGQESFETMLARELGGELSQDIVKQAAIVLRNGDSGTIRLSLKPETLGNVKIRLEMADNKIAGHIIVESDEALRAFEREIHTLEQAFEDSGFEQANLELAMDFRNREDRQWRDEAGPFFSERFAGSLYDGESAGLEAEGRYGSALGISAINMLA
jgi:flagellar hook-length control protein FliK